MLQFAPVRHEIADAAGFGWNIPTATFDWPTLIANKDKEIARLEAAYTANVEKSGGPHRRDFAQCSRTRIRFQLLTTGETVRREICADCDRRHAKPQHEIPGIEHVDLLKRGVPPD